MKKISLVILMIALAITVTEAKAQSHEGDTLKFWSVSYIDWPPLWGSPQRQFDAVCKKAGDHCYVFVEVGATVPLQSDIDNLVTRYDTQFYPSLTSKYGPVPDALDHDSSIFILVLNESDWAGYFDPGMQMPDTMVWATWTRHSSEHELIYVAASAFYAAEGIVAHEMGHLCHWLQDHSPEATTPPIYWETAFVDEGFSTFAEEYLTGNLDQWDVMDNAAFFQSDPDIPLIYFTNYDQAQLFMTFMYEQYGGWSYISALLRNQVNGWQGVDSTLRLLGYSQTFDDAFEQWCVANYIDDSLYQGGKYAYRHFSFPNASLLSTHSFFPTGVHSEQLSAYGCDYVKFTSMTAKPIQIEFTGTIGSHYRIAFMMMNPSGYGVKEVVCLQPDSTQHLLFAADSLGIAYNQLIMAVMCTDPMVDENSTSSYTYSAVGTAALNESEKITPLKIYPNPAQDKLSFDWPSGKGEKGTIEIYDTAGNRVLNASINKKTRSVDIQSLATGTYSVIIRIAEKVSSGTFVKS